MRHKIPVADPVDVHVGSRIKKLRIQRGVSQAELAKVLNLTFQQIQKYEKGTNRISASSLYHIAKYLDVDVEYFYAGFDTNPDLPANRKTGSIVKFFNSAPQEIQSAVLKMLRVFSVDQAANEPITEEIEEEELIA